MSQECLWINANLLIRHSVLWKRLACGSGSMISQQEDRDQDELSVNEPIEDVSK